MKQYLSLTKAPANLHVPYASSYLEGEPDRLWAAEHDRLKALNPAVLWAQFDALLNRNFATIAPVTAYYREYEHLHQVSNVADYVAQMKTLCS